MLGWERIISTMLGPGESPHCSLPHCVLLASGLESSGEYSTLYSTQSTIQSTGEYSTLYSTQSTIESTGEYSRQLGGAVGELVRVMRGSWQTYSHSCLGHAAVQSY